MFYLVSSIVLLGLILFVEFKRSEVFGKFNQGCSFKKSLKNDFSVVKFICISLLFMSLAMIVVIKLERGGFVSSVHEEFKLEFLPYILYSSFLVPVFEEYFYRFLPYSFKKFSNNLIYVLVVFFSSLLFTYFHRVDLFESVFIFLMAVIFSIIYLKTKNISYTIGCHSMYNLMTFVRIYTGYSNAGVFMVLFLVSLGVLFYYNERGKAK